MKRLINRRPSLGVAVLMGLLPFVLMVLLYSYHSALRLHENPDDRLLPSLTQLVQGVKMVAVNEDPRTGQIVLWADTAASLERIGIAMAVCAVVGLLFGMLNGMLPWLRALGSPESDQNARTLVHKIGSNHHGMGQQQRAGDIQPE